MAEVNIDVAKEESVQAVNTKVGTSSDTASSTPTTLFAGIKGLIAWFTGTWTAARAAKVDTIDTNVDTISTNTAYSATASSTGTLSQKLAYIISTLIGATNATGGTSTAGTLMSKLNALLTSWTSTRAGYVDTIKTNTDYLKTQRQASLTGVGATAFSSSLSCQLDTIGMYRYYCIAKFIAPISGIYTVTLNASAPAGSGNWIEVVKAIDSPDPVNGSYEAANSTYTVNEIYNRSVVNTYTGTYTTDGGTIARLFSTLLGKFFVSASSSANGTYTFFCKEGEPIALFGRTVSSNIYVIFNSCTVTYQPN